MADSADHKQFVLPGINPELNGTLPWDTFMEVMGIEPEQFTQRNLTAEQINDLRRLLDKFRQINDIGVLTEYGVAALYRAILEMGRNTEINIMVRLHKEWRRKNFDVDYDIKNIKHRAKYTIADRKELQRDIARVSLYAISAKDYSRGLALLTDFIIEKYSARNVPDTVTFALVLDLMNEINNILRDTEELEKEQVTLGRQLRFALANIIRQTYSPDFLEAILREAKSAIIEEP